MINQAQKLLDAATYNVKFLESKIIPLSEDNASLKQSIHALVYYMEERRIEFASLLRSGDRELIVKLGDLPTIFQHLKQDQQSYEKDIRELTNKIKQLDEQIHQSQSEQLAMKSAHNRVINDYEQRAEECRLAYKAQLDSRERQHAQLLVQIQEQVQSTSQAALQHSKELHQRDEEHNQIVASMKLSQLDNEKKLQQVKADFQLQRDKIEANHVQELNAMKSDMNDKLNKLDVKNRQTMIELQNCKQDHQQLTQTYNTVLKLSQKQKRQVENQLAAIKSIKDESLQQRVEKQELIKEVEHLKSELEKSNRGHAITQSKVVKLMGQVDELQKSNSTIIHQKQLEHKALIQEIKDKEQEIKKEQESYSMNQQHWQKQHQIQKIKYELMLDQNKVIEGEESQYLLVHEETQFDCPVTKERFEENERVIAEQSMLINKQTMQIQQSTKYYQQQIDTLKTQHENKLKKVLQELEQRILKERQTNKYQLEQLNILQEAQIKEIQEQHQQQLVILIGEHNNNCSKLQGLIDNISEELKQVKQTVQFQSDTILNLNDDLFNQANNYEIKLAEINRNNIADKEKANKYHQDQLDQLRKQLEQLTKYNEEIINNKCSDSKVIMDQLRKIEQISQQLQLAKDECITLQEVIDNQEQVVSQSTGQVNRANEIIKYLQFELENTKQVYNIFKNSQSSQGKLQLLDEQPQFKGDIKKILVFKQPVKHNTRQLQQQQRQKKVLNLSQPSNIFLQYPEKSLPRIRSISQHKNDASGSTPRLLSQAQ